MVIWMKEHSRGLKGELESMTAQALDGRGRMGADFLIRVVCQTGDDLWSGDGQRQATAFQGIGERDGGQLLQHHGFAAFFVRDDETCFQSGRWPAPDPCEREVPL